jgi:phosphatidylinositol-3-phosphatase
MSFRTRALILGASVLVLLAGCAVPAPPIADPTPTTPTATPTPIPTAVPTPGSGVSKVMVFVLENHSLDQAMRAMPFTMGLLTEHAYATHFNAITHPSLPNYLAFTGGSTFGVKDSHAPIEHPISGPSIFGSAIAAGRTAAVFAEGMQENCQLVRVGRYAAKHNPWTYYVDERDLCGQFDVPLEKLPAVIDAGALPNVGMVVPDLCSDAHDCPLSTTDAFYKKWLPLLMAGPDYTSGKLAIVLTADEDEGTTKDPILTGVIHQGTPPRIVTDPLTLYSLGRMLHDVTGTEYLGKSAQAPSMMDAFGLTVTPP